ncbi:MAG: hypothetical protein B6244_08820 [Candidatus Cloacimonetes bacterium 4572_55]|nr:MAG: hypothetical protein B6244_08820 [Candidatus Cloacimonetes bacterium 4572_55]
MECDNVAALLSDMYEGAITEDLKKKVENHFSQCHDCQREYQYFRKTLKLLVYFPKIETSLDFERQLRQRLQQSKPTLWDSILSYVPTLVIPRPSFVPILAMTTACVIMGASGFFLRGYMPLSTSPSMTSETVAPVSSDIMGGTKPTQTFPGDPSINPVQNSPTNSFVLPTISPKHFNTNEPYLIKGNKGETLENVVHGEKYVIRPIHPDSFDIYDAVSDTSKNSLSQNANKFQF